MRLGRLRRDGGPLAAGREGRAAAAHELRRGDLGDDGLGADLEGPGQGRVAAVGAVVVERGRVDDADPAEQAQIDSPAVGAGVAVGAGPRRVVRPRARATTPTASTGASANGRAASRRRP